MWNEPWKREDWVISRQGVRILTWAFWGQIPFFLLTPFLAYWSVLWFLGKPVAFVNLPVKIVLGTAGGIYAICAFALSDGMNTFEQGRKVAGEPPRKLLHLIPVSLFVLGPMIYFWLTYKPKMHEAGFGHQ